MSPTILTFPPPETDAPQPPGMLVPLLSISRRKLYPMENSGFDCAAAGCTERNKANALNTDTITVRIFTRTPPGVNSLTLGFYGLSYAFVRVRRRNAPEGLFKPIKNCRVTTAAGPAPESSQGTDAPRPWMDRLAGALSHRNYRLLWFAAL